MTIATRHAPTVNMALADDDHEQIVIRQDKRDGAALHRRRALDRAGPGPRRDAPEALPGRPARGARRRDGPGAHDDAEGVGRGPRPRRRQGRDDRRRPPPHARRPARGRRARDRRTRRRVHHGRGHRHHHRRHGPPRPLHALRGRPVGLERRRRRPVAGHRRDGLPGDAPRAGRGHRVGRLRRAPRRRGRARQGRLGSSPRSSRRGRGRDRLRPRRRIAAPGRAEQTTASRWRRRPRRSWRASSTCSRPAPPAA